MRYLTLLSVLLVPSCGAVYAGDLSDAFAAEAAAAAPELMLVGVAVVGIGMAIIVIRLLGSAVDYKHDQHDVHDAYNDEYTSAEHRANFEDAERKGFL